MAEKWVTQITQRSKVSVLGRHALSAFMVAGLAVGFLSRAPAAWAAGRAQTEVDLNEATESIEAQQGVDEPDGPNNDAQLNEAQEGIDELEGQNNDSQVNEGQEGVDEQEGQNNDSQLDDGQDGVDEADGQNSEAEPPAAP